MLNWSESKQLRKECACKTWGGLSFLEHTKVLFHLFLVFNSVMGTLAMWWLAYKMLRLAYNNVIGRLQQNCCQLTKSRIMQNPSLKNTRI